MTDEKDPYNDGYTHEALHSAHICVSMWDEFVTNTRCADQYPDIKEAAAKAGRAMADVYQMLGMKFADEPPNDKCVDCGSEGNCKPGCPSRL